MKLIGILYLSPIVIQLLSACCPFVVRFSTVQQPNKNWIGTGQELEIQ